MAGSSTKGGETEIGREVSLSSARLEAIIASAMDAIIAVDHRFLIIAFNPAAERMFGVSATAVLGKPLDQFIPVRFRGIHHNHVDRFFETGTSYRRMGALGSISALRANGEEFPVEASISQAIVEDERISTVILRDISERRANEETLLLAREVDHRARNILALVSSLIAQTSAPTVEAYAASLASRVAALSRANSMLARERWRGASLSQLVGDELAAHTSERQIDLSGPDLALTARAAQPISMVLHELAANAVKHGALGSAEGHVAVRWSRQADGRIHLAWRERGGPTVTAPDKLGFGVTLLEQIVDSQLGGSHIIAWNPAGFEFETFLPESVLQSPAPEQAPPSSQPQALAPAVRADSATDADAAPGTLLIVEDEPLLAMQMSQSLEKFGWKVLGVAGSLEGANKLLSSIQRPDVAILDVDLGGEPVFPLARSLRRAGIPFLFCTGFEDIGYIREFSDCPVVRKPATVLQVVAALRQIVHDAGDAAIRDRTR